MHMGLDLMILHAFVSFQLDVHVRLLRGAACKMLPVWMYKNVDSEAL